MESNILSVLKTTIIAKHFVFNIEHSNYNTNKFTWFRARAERQMTRHAELINTFSNMLKIVKNVKPDL